MPISPLMPVYPRCGVRPVRDASDPAVEAMGRFVQADKRVLRNVAGVGLVAEDRAGQAVGARLVALHQ